MPTYSAVTATERAAGTVFTETIIGKLVDNPLSWTTTASGAPTILSEYLDTVSPDAGSVGQSELNDALESGLIDADVDTHADFTNVGYSFLPTFRYDTITGSPPATVTVTYESVLDTTDTTNFHAGASIPSSAGLEVTYNMRYIQASPPYYLSGQEVKIFCYVLKHAGAIKAIKVLEDPPWVVLGPTLARADLYVDGKPYMINRDKTHLSAYVQRLKAVYELTKGNHQGRAFKQEFKRKKNAFIEITPEIKNADILIEPHPFKRMLNRLNNDPSYTIELIDPRLAVANDLYLLHKAGENLPRMIKDGQIALGAPVADQAIAGAIMVDATL